MTRKLAGLLVLVCLLFPSAVISETQEDQRNAHGTFTGEIKAVIYVSDVEKSAPFYRDVLGFDFEGYAGPEDSPYYAEMVAAHVKFGLHEPIYDGQEAKIGQQRIYFRVKDIEQQRIRVQAWGGNPGDIKKTDWMDMFLVRDSDGNEIIFAFTDPERHSIYPWDTLGGK
jgi:predicted enzyme related to lactoylglutathione lyase